MHRNKVFPRLLAVMLAVMLLAPSLASADETIYNSWSEFQKSDYYSQELGGHPTWNDIVVEMDKLLDAGKKAFAAGDMEAAYEYVNNAYYGWYETTGFERTAMGYIGNGRKSEVELAFAAPKAVATKNGDKAEYDAEVDELSAMLHEDANKLDGTTGESGNSSEGGVGGSMGAAATFLASFSILVREGLEAILVVGAIIAYLVKSGNKKSLKSVYIGAALGVVCSFVCAWLLNMLKFANAAPQEIIEGVTALLAVVVLYYVSNWMLSKSETEAWNSYIQGQVDSSVKTGSGFALAFTAWLSVFREGAEVILFYQPLLVTDQMPMVWAGMGAAAVVLVIVYVAVRYFSVKLPLRPFFRITSIFMFCMAISFLGNGIKELIEGNVLTSTPFLENIIPYNEPLAVLGIYPIAETLIPQLILVAITIGVYVWQVRRAERLVDKIEAMENEPVPDASDGTPSKGDATSENDASNGGTATAREG